MSQIMPGESSFGGGIRPIPGGIEGTITDPCEGKRKNVFDKEGNPVGCILGPVYNPKPPKIGGLEDLDNIEPLNDDESDEETKTIDDYIFEPLTDAEYEALLPRLEAAREKLTGYENSKIRQILLVKSITEKGNTSGTIISGVTIGRTIVLTPKDLEDTLFHESWHVVDKYLRGDNASMKKSTSDKENQHNLWLLRILEQQMKARKHYLDRIKSYKEVSTEGLDALHEQTLKDKQDQESALKKLFIDRYNEKTDEARETASKGIKIADYIGEAWIALQEPTAGFFTEYSSHSANEDQAEIWKGIHNPTFKNSRGDTLSQAVNKDPLLNAKIKFIFGLKPEMLEEILKDYGNRLKN